MAHTAADHQAHEHHIVPTRVYLLTLIELVCLMALTVYAARFNLPDLGPISGTVVNQVVALVIALIKAFLVVTVFMGVKFGTKLIKLWACAGFIWVTLIFTILGDYTTRHYELAPGWDGKPDAALPRVTPADPQMPPPNDLNVKIRQ